MKTAFLLSALAITTVAAQPFTQVWVQRHNGSGNGDDTAVAITVDTNGNTFIAGYSTGTNGFVTIKYSSEEQSEIITLSYSGVLW